MRRLLSVLLIAIVGFVLTTYGVNLARAQNQVEIRWLEWWVNEWGPDTHGALISNFEAQNPNIKVRVVDVPWMAMPEKLKAAALGDESYDVFGTETDWISSMMKLGYVESLDPWLQKNSSFMGSLTTMTPMRLKGQTRGLCLYLIPYQFAYNVDLFKKKGLNPPRNWDEFVSVMQAFRDKANGTYGTILALKDGSYIMTRILGYRLAQEGGEYIDKTGKVAFNSPQGVAAVTWWKNFLNMDLAVPGATGHDQSQMGEFLAAGRVAGIIDGPFVWTKAKQINPDVNIAYAPAWKAKTGGYYWACSGIAMSAKSQHKAEAWEFIKYLYSNEAAIKMTQKTRIPWATKAAMKSLEGSSDPILGQIASFANQDPPHNLLHPVLPEGEKLVDALKLAFQEAVTGKKDVKTALDEAAKIWQEEIDKLR